MKWWMKENNRQLQLSNHIVLFRLASHYHPLVRLHPVHEEAYLWFCCILSVISAATGRGPVNLRANIYIGAVPKITHCSETWARPSVNASSTVWRCNTSALKDTLPVDKSPRKTGDVPMRHCRSLWLTCDKLASCCCCCLYKYGLGHRAGGSLVITTSARW